MFNLPIAGTLVSGAGVLVALEAVTAHGRRCRTRVRRIAHPGNGVVDECSLRLAQSPQQRMLQPVAVQLAAIATRVTPRGNRAQLHSRLRRAGLTIAPTRFLTIKGALATTPLAIAMLVATRGGSLGQVLLITMFAPVGLLAPDCWLTSRQRARRRAIDRDVPDVLDLLTVSVEAGLGFDASALKVTERLDGPLAHEISVMMRELRLGESRRDAIAALVDRTGSDDVSAFARAIVQGDELGVSLGRTLRVQSADLRERRRLAAEERATKAPVKMLFPTVLFIFPALFVVTLGPAALNILKLFRG